MIDKLETQLKQTENQHINLLLNEDHLMGAAVAAASSMP